MCMCACVRVVFLGSVSSLARFKTRPSPALVFSEKSMAPETQMCLAFGVNVFREMTARAACLVTGNPNWHGRVTIGEKLAHLLCC